MSAPRSPAFALTRHALSPRRPNPRTPRRLRVHPRPRPRWQVSPRSARTVLARSLDRPCLLYTSDAADDM
eukprot:12898232-Alexandrium_andersonii.AAC.1